MLVAANALNAHMVGSGPEVLVLVHGFGSDQSVWAGYLPWLSQHYRVITYDLPFSGSADPAFFNLNRHGTIEGHVEDLLDILHGDTVTRCSLIGHSLGGLIGIFAAIAQPDLFERLILIGTSARYLDAPGYKGGMDIATLDASFAAVAANFRGWAEAFTPVAIGKPLEDPTAQTFLASLLRTRPDIAIAMARPIFLGDYREPVKQCTTPAVILQTEEDHSVPMEAALTLQQCLQDSRLEIIKTAGHLPHLSAPEAMADAFRRHLPRLAKDARGRSRL
jgi:pimeloyl-ACP methyl ester carboxylesterase